MISHSSSLPSFLACSGLAPDRRLQHLLAREELKDMTWWWESDILPDSAFPGVALLLPRLSSSFTLLLVATTGGFLLKGPCDA
jgi:hypothetical protein